MQAMQERQATQEMLGQAAMQATPEVLVIPAIQVEQAIQAEQVVPAILATVVARVRQAMQALLHHRAVLLCLSPRRQVIQ